MHGLVLSETGSGLVAAFAASDELSVRAALKSHDRDLDLAWKVMGDERIWYVVKGDAWICDWVTEHGEPLPLSHGLVEMVKQLDGNSRAPVVDHEALNDRMRDAAQADHDAETEWLAGELVKRYRGKGGVVLPRGSYRRHTDFKDIRR